VKISALGTDPQFVILCNSNGWFYLLCLCSYNVQSVGYRHTIDREDNFRQRAMMMYANASHLLHLQHKLKVTATASWRKPGLIESP
jgi:hypothetical protein